MTACNSYVKEKSSTKKECKKNSINVLSCLEFYESFISQEGEATDE